MRESEIRAQRIADARRMAMIINQLEFVQLRMQALESIISEKLKPMMESDKEWLKKKMDEKHLDLIKESNAEREAVRQKREDEQNRPKLILLNSNGHVA